jgi:AraC family ethanolamine operon transcriptional activator
MTTEQENSSTLETRKGSGIAYARTDFSAVEEMELAARSFGWSVEYQQWRSGPFYSAQQLLECGGISLISAHFGSDLNISCEPPQGYIGVTVPGLVDGQVDYCGHTITDGDVIVFPAGCELDVVTSGKCHAETLFMQQSDFLKAARAILGSDNPIPTDAAYICRGNPVNLAKFRQLIISIQFLQGLDPENASTLLSEAILLAAGTTNLRDSEKLAGSASTRVAHRARDFIEAHLDDTTRFDKLCANSGASLRTIQRCFATHFQISPTDYIKARRLNAARRILARNHPQEQTVTNIAMSVGCFHLGRFSADYLDFFGEHPSDTLKRSKEPLAI